MAALDEFGDRVSSLSLLQAETGGRSGHVPRISFPTIRDGAGALAPLPLGSLLDDPLRRCGAPRWLSIIAIRAAQPPPRSGEGAVASALLT